MKKARPPASSRQDSVETPLLMYVLYLVAVLLMVTGIIGLVWAYIERRHAKGWLNTHYTYLIHTFWKGILYILTGALLTAAMPSLFIALIAGWLWWIIRCIKGMRLLLKREPVPAPDTWLI